MVKFSRLDTQTSRLTDLGLFLSPDPVLQDPANALNYNRYSYVLNNPLKYTDPSGYLFYYKEAWISDYKDWVSNPFGSGGCFESPATGRGSRRGDPRLNAYSAFVKSLGSSIDWREFYAQFGYKAKEIWQIGSNKIGVHYIDGKMEQLDFTSVVSSIIGDWPSTADLEKDFADSFNEKVVKNYVDNPDYKPQNVKQLANDLLYSGDLFTQKHYFGLRPIEMRITTYENNMFINTQLYYTDPYINSDLPTVLSPGYYAPLVIYGEGNTAYQFVIRYQIRLPF